MKIIDLADEIHRELDSPDDLSMPQIIFWLENNIGQLNVLINENIEIDAREFSPELTIEQANIFKHLFLIKHYSKMIKNNLGAAAYDFSEISEGDSKIRKVSKNEVAKTYMQLRGAYQQELTELVHFYKSNQIKPDGWDYTDTIDDYS